MEVQLCREFGWTREELYSQDEDWVWSITQVLSLEGEKMQREMGNGPPQRRRPLV